MDEKLKTKNKLLFMLYSACLGAAIGLVVWIFLRLTNVGIDLIWHKGADLIKIPCYTLLVCVLGGILIGVVQKKYNGYPETMHEVMGKVKKDGRYSYKNIFGTFITALLAMFFGGSVGFEAGLVGIIAGLCTWAGDKFKKLSKEMKELAQIGISATLGTIFQSPMFGFMEPIENDEQPVFPKKAKIVLYVLCILGALTMFKVLSGIFGAGSGFAHFEDFAANAAEWVGILPLCIVGVLCGLLFTYSEKLSKQTFESFKNNTVVRGVIGGLILGVAGTFLPYVMFSGEKEMEQLILNWQEIGAVALILTGVIKIVVTNICMDTGFKGGNILPIMFAGMCIGFGIGMLTGMNLVFCACIVATTITAYILKTPIAVALLMVMFFPIESIPYMLLAAVLGSWCNGGLIKNKDQ